MELPGCADQTKLFQTRQVRCRDTFTFWAPNYCLIRLRVMTKYFLQLKITALHSDVK